jgi:hypothetical protein
MRWSAESYAIRPGTRRQGHATTLFVRVDSHELAMGGCRREHAVERRHDEDAVRSGRRDRLHDSTPSCRDNHEPAAGCEM